MKKINIYRFAPYVLLIIPVTISFTFLILPTLLSLSYSFQSYNLTKPDRIKFIGFDNYLKFFSDSTLRMTIFNSFYILMFMIVISVIGAIILGLILSGIRRGRGLLLAVVILPWALPPVVNSLLWGNIFSPTYGALNALLYKIGIIDSYVVWTNSAFVTINLICLILVWKYLPLMAIMVLATLQSIPEELYEAARIDGADPYRSFLHITLPAIVPTMAIILSISSIVAINVFDEIYVFARFRADTRSLAMEAYMRAFKFLDLGYGSAIAYILLIIGISFSILYLKNLYKEI